MTDRLENRLAALRVDSPSGDWLDCVRRSRRRARVRRLTVLAAAVIVAVALVPLGVADRVADLLSVSPTDEPVPAPSGGGLTYVYGDRIAGREGGGRLAEPVLAPLVGPDAYLAVSSPDGDSIAYHAWRPEGDGGRSVLRVHDLETGRDEVLAKGAQTLAWRVDGALAYVVALRPDYRNTPEGTTGGRIGHVVVRSDRAGPARRWTTEATEYNVLAWARTTLLVSVRPSAVYRAPQPERGVYALDGPGRIRSLPITNVTAVSPDGERAVGTWQPADSPSPTVRVVDVARGTILAETAVRPSGLQAPGDWRGDTVIGVSTSESGSALLVLRAEPRRITVRTRLELDERAGLHGYRGALFSTPLFVGPGGVVVRVTTVRQDENDSATRLLTCDLVARSCRSGRALEPPRRWAAVVANPSRPRWRPASESERQASGGAARFGGLRMT
jgi:hypothetical protein